MINHSSRAMTFLEIMLSVLILALSILPITRMLSSVTTSAKQEKCEAEAMQFACDMLDHILMKMEYEPAKIASPPWQIVSRGFTDIKYQIQTGAITWVNIATPKITYHDPCADGIETNSNFDSQVTTDPHNFTLRELDREKFPDAVADDFDLLDIKLVVLWKPKGTEDVEYDRHPIILYTRKARL